MAAINTQHVVLLKDEPFDLDIHTLIFTHIPKCGGTTLHETFSRILGSDRYRVFSGANSNQTEMNRLRGAGGHQRFGANPLHRRKSPLVYTTVIREPFAQFISYYHHVLRDPHHHLRRDNPSIADLSPMEMIDYHLEIGNHSISNIQSAMLAPSATTSAEVIEQVAKHYSLVGTLEKLSQYADALSTMFPQSDVKLNRLNENPARLRRPRFGLRKLRQRIYDLNQRDLALYESFTTRRLVAPSL